MPIATEKISNDIVIGTRKPSFASLAYRVYFNAIIYVIATSTDYINL